MGVGKKTEAARDAKPTPGSELLECIELPILVIDRDCTIVSFNPAAATLLSLASSDFGRPLRDIQMLAEVQNLEELCEHVIAGGASSRLDVADGSGSWFSLKIGCYRSDNGNIGGAVLTFSNVTAFRESLERAIEEREYTKAVLNTIAEALVVVDEDLRVQAANHAFYALFQTSREISQGAHLYKLGSQHWDIARLRALLSGSVLPNGGLGAAEFDLKFSIGGRRILLLNARRLVRGSHAGQMTLIAIQDITERNHAMNALRESEQRFRVITDAAPIMVWMAGTDRLCYYFNKGWLDFVGRTLEQEAGNGWAENVHPEDFDRCLQVYITSFEVRQSFEMEYRLRHKSGQYRWILGHGVPRFAPDGTFEGYIAACLDIHEQKEAAEKGRTAAETQRESEERLRLAQQVATIGTFEWDIQSNVNRWTPELEAIYGLPPGGFAGTQEAWQELIHPEDRALVLGHVNLGFQSGAPVQAEWRVIWPDGGIHWVLGRWQVFKDDAGNPKRMTGINIDITSRKQAEEARRRLAAIVESSNDAIISKDLNGVVTSWNPAAEKIFGYSAQEMIGRSITTIIPPDFHEDERRILETIGRGERIEQFETVRLTKSGERIDVWLTISPVRDEVGKIVGAAKIARDITQQKKTEHALRTTERLASVGRLAATVAHEINNPLEALTNLVYLAKGSAVLEDVRDYLAEAEEELDRISHLTKQTLGFYRETKGASVVRVGELLQGLISVFAARARNKTIEICPEIRKDPEIHAVPGEIRQLIANLLSNSIDAAQPGGRIRIRISASATGNGQPSKGVRITVADAGPGIPPAVRAKLFEPFFTTKKDVGTGLGLWVCKNIVEKHCGSIRVKSSTVPGGSGTVFSVFLPSEHEEELQGELSQAT